MGVAVPRLCFAVVCVNLYHHQASNKSSVERGGAARTAEGLGD